MSSWVLETYYQNDIYAKYEWDKYTPHFVVFVGKKHNDGLIYTLWTKRYATKESAKLSFKRQVVKIKRGKY